VRGRGVEGNRREEGGKFHPDRGGQERGGRQVEKLPGALNRLVSPLPGLFLSLPTGGGALVLAFLRDFVLPGLFLSLPAVPLSPRPSPQLPVSSADLTPLDLSCHDK
jgi:hypothetical protein